jgi:hypothetical protein
MKKIVNITPHVIRMNDGREFPPSGTVARVSTQYSHIIDDVATVTFGEIQGMPEPQDDTVYIASAIVAKAAQMNGRKDVFSPATNHPQAVRKDGQVWSVPCFCRE